jgi:hypothetical protein
MAALAVLIAPVMVSCSGSVLSTAPSCSSVERVALVAESVPSASYVPCLSRLPTGWTSRRFVAERGSTRFELLSDRAGGRAVTVAYRRSCATAGAAPFPPRSAGGRTLLRLASVQPRYTGTLIDVFPGGCVVYRFDFLRGPHIALMAELQEAVRLVSRLELRNAVRHRLGVELGP